jgi:hypothetical protein
MTLTVSLQHLIPPNTGRAGIADYPASFSVIEVRKTTVTTAPAEHKS